MSRSSALERIFLTGVAVEGLVGLEDHIGPRVSAFADYKLSFSSNDADVKGGGTLETEVWTNHIIFGLSYRLGARRRCHTRPLLLPIRPKRLQKRFTNCGRFPILG
jgi:hypothetical protein